MASGVNSATPATTSCRTRSSGHSQFRSRNLASYVPATRRGCGHRWFRAGYRSLKGRWQGPRHCPCFVKREASSLAGRRSVSHKGQAGPTFRRSEVPTCVYLCSSATNSPVEPGVCFPARGEYEGLCENDGDTCIVEIAVLRRRTRGSRGRSGNPTARSNWNRLRVAC
jgi:hypothetical protein